MNRDITNMNTSEQEIVGCYMECHGPNSRCKEEPAKWVEKMLDKLGPDDCRFLIRSRSALVRNMWMSKGVTYSFTNDIRIAGRFTWGAAAVKITNNPKLEAVRIINDREAVDSNDVSIDLDPPPIPIPIVDCNAPVRIPIVDGPPPMPNYHGRCDMHYGLYDGALSDCGNLGGNIAQNGEQLPGPTDE